MNQSLHLGPYVIFSTLGGLQMFDFEVEELKKKKKKQSCPRRNEEVRALQCLARAAAHDALSGLSNILNFHLPAPSPL